jgi:cyanophycinase
MSPAQTSDGLHRGYIVPIGGAEDKVGDAEILKRVLKLCGVRPSMAIIPTASRKEDTGRNYQSLFEGFGANAYVLNFLAREDCEDPEALKILADCDGVFITGGNQLRLSTTLGGTSVAKLLRRRNANGMPIAGTSAGAAIMPEHMIAFGDEGPSPRVGMVALAPGLGLSNKIMVDQHFRQRDRLGRLLTAVALNPFALALGIDENTACFIGPDNVLEVVGSGSVTIIDPAEVRHNSLADHEDTQAVALSDLRLHLLTTGCAFDIDSRRPLVL